MRKAKSSSSKAQSAFTGSSVADIFTAFGNGNDSGIAESSIDYSVLNSLKSLDKRDPVTRVRALQEFASKYSSGESREATIGVVSHFLHYYRRGALLDPDWKCRSLYHNGLRILCESLGRQIEPFLKDFVPICTLSMHERSYREVSSAAARVLESLFPNDEKRMKVVEHFHETILQIIGEYFSSTPQILDKQFRHVADSEDTAFESIDRFGRVISSSIRCCLFLLMNLGAPMASRVIELNPFRFLTGQASARNDSIRAASIELTKWFVENNPESIKKEMDLITPTLVADLTSEDVHAWELLKLISQHVKIKPARLLDLLRSTDIRQVSPTMVSTTASIYSLDDRSDWNVFVDKLREGVSLDHRIRLKYEDVLKSIIDSCSLVGARTGGGCIQDVLSVCKADPSLRRYAVLKVAKMKGPLLELSPNIVGTGAYLFLSENEMVPPATNSLVEADMSEIRFYLELSPTGKCVHALVEGIEGFISSHSPLTADGVVVLDRILDQVEHEKLTTVRSSIGITDLVRLAYRGKDSNSQWIERLKASEKFPFLIDQLVDSNELQNAFIQAVEFRKNLQVSSSAGLVDNGIIRIGSIEYNDLVINVMNSAGLEVFAGRLIATAVDLRTQTGIEGYLNDSIAFEAFKRDMSMDNPVVDLLSVFPSFRSKCCLEFASHTTDSIDEKILPLLFVSTEDISVVLQRAVASNQLSNTSLSLIDYPLLDISINCPTDLLVRFFSLALRTVPRDGRVSHVISLWRTQDIGDFISLLTGISALDSFETAPVLRRLLEGREKTVEDSAVVSNLLKDLMVTSRFKLFMCRLIVSNFHVSLELTDELVRKLELLQCDGLQNYRNAILICLDRGYMAVDEPHFVGRSQSDPIEVARANEETFAIDMLNFIEREKTNCTVPSLTFVDTKPVADLLLRTDCDCEAAYNRFTNLAGSDITSVDTRIIDRLEAQGSLGWALARLDSDMIESGLARLSHMDLVDLVTNPLVFERMRKSSEDRTLLGAVVRVKLWKLVLEKFVSVKTDTFCFFVEFIEESLVGRTDDHTNVTQLKEEFWTLGLSLIDIIQKALRSGDDKISKYLYSDAVDLMPLLLKSAPPGEIHDWASSHNVPEKVLVEHGISSELIQSEVSGNKYRNDNLRTNFSLSSKLLMCNYSSHDGEIKAELSVRFPECWPLRLGQVEVSPVVGLAKAKNARLKVAIQSVFRLNGVQNAIQIWIENIEGFLKDVEECYICYSVTYHHGTKTGGGGSIPNKQCRTCKYKFHSECLLKYFRTSGKTICCLCQNPF